jgi:hypothetical protein
VETDVAPALPGWVPRRTIYHLHALGAAGGGGPSVLIIEACGEWDLRLIFDGVSARFCPVPFPTIPR